MLVGRLFALDGVFEDVFEELLRLDLTSEVLPTLVPDLVLPSMKLVPDLDFPSKKTGSDL